MTQQSYSPRRHTTIISGSSRFHTALNIHMCCPCVSICLILYEMKIIHSRLFLFIVATENDMFFYNISCNLAPIICNLLFCSKQKIGKEYCKNNLSSLSFITTNTKFRNTFYTGSSKKKLAKITNSSISTRNAPV